MSLRKQLAPARRDFLRKVGGASGAALAMPVLLGGMAPRSAQADAPAKAAGEQGRHLAYLSLGPQEGACLEALVNVMCPADDLTPSGVDCGLHIYIDRQLAGAWGRGDKLYRQGPWQPGKPEHGYQSSLTPEQYFKSGLAALRGAAQRQNGMTLEQLDAAQLDVLLQKVSAGRLDDSGHALGAWFNDSLYPLFVQACFADPAYDGNRGKVFWRAVGYPGLPAFHGRDVSQFRGRPYPGAARPQSIEDFS